MMKDAAFEAASEQFMDWLKAVPGVQVSDKIALWDYTDSNSGRGVIATETIGADEQLFSIPRTALLSWQNSKLQSHLHLDEETLATLGDWNLLILTMLYESSRQDSRWSSYFAILPHQFSTPMFWSSEEVEALQASTLRDKIGREEADQVYHETILPLLQCHSEHFDLSKCSLQDFHRMGSLIMAYSFDSPILPKQASHIPGNGIDNDDDEEEEEEEEECEKVMCPLSDLLNADTTLNNARLFHTPDALVMRSTCPIDKNSQIFNTYGDLPNTDLLRRYGYVQIDNPHDCVELPGDAVTNIIPGLSERDRMSRTDWLLDMEILDDSFEIASNGKLPSAVFVTIHALLATNADFAAMRRAEEPPKPVKTARVRDLVIGILQGRLSAYKTTTEQDEQYLHGDLTNNARNAVIVRLSEKRILHRALDLVRDWDVVDESTSQDSKKRRMNALSSGGTNKKGRNV